MLAASQADTEDKAAVGEDIPKAVQASQLIPRCNSFSRQLASRTGVEGHR